MRWNDLARTTIKLRGYLELEVAGSSMMPTLCAGETVRIEALQSAEPGTLVVFPGARSGHPVLHRVVACQSGSICAIGDNGRKGAWVDECDVIGKVAAVRINGTWVALWPDGLMRRISQASLAIAHLIEGAEETLFEAQISSLERSRLRLCVELRERLEAQLAEEA